VLCVRLLRAPLDARTARHVTPGRDIAQRRRAKHPAVLAAAWGGARLADLKRHGRGIQALREHQPPRFVQPQPFWVLQRTHGRQRPEGMMEGRWTQMDVRGEGLDPEREGGVPLQPRDGLRELRALPARRRAPCSPTSKRYPISRWRSGARSGLSCGAASRASNR
jgi:hypothetical protein